MAISDSTTEEEKNQQIAILRPACLSYSQFFLQSPSIAQQVQSVERIKESTLTKMNEIHTAVDLTRTDIDRITESLTPLLLSRTEHLTNVFALIDKMGEYVEKVRNSVLEMENQLNAAEAANAGAIRKKFNAFLGKPDVANPPPPASYDFIVTAEDFFTSLR